VTKLKLVPTTTTPFCFVDIRGNICKCAGCRGNLKNGPGAIDGFNPLDLSTDICLKHKEQDYVFISQRKEWVPKFKNKHYHVYKYCLISRSPHLQMDNVLTNFLEIQQINFPVKQFLMQRLQ